MNIKMRNAYIGVQKSEKTKQKNQDALFHIPENSDNFGVIRYIGEKYDGALKVGDPVIYGTKRERFKIEGLDIEVMLDDNVVAVLD